MKIYEPTGMFKVVNIKKPMLSFGRIWFTKTLMGKYQLHVGIFNEIKRELKVWKTRDINPVIKLIQTGVRYHKRNSLLDQPIYERVVRLPFLQKGL